MTKLTWEELWFEESLDSRWGSKDLGEDVLYCMIYETVACYKTYKSPDAYSGEVPFDESIKFSEILFMIVAEKILVLSSL